MLSWRGSCSGIAFVDWRPGTAGWPDGLGVGEQIQPLRDLIVPQVPNTRLTAPLYRVMKEARLVLPPISIHDAYDLTTVMNQSSWL